jgi:phosphoribosylanthranilate isomerase
MMAFIKVCGIQTRDEADAALGCGATALGFLVGLTHRAEDEIGEAEARAILQGLPAQANAVLVTHLPDPERVAELAASVGASTIQVHGEMAVTDLRRLRAQAPGKRLIKAVHVTGEDASAAPSASCRTRTRCSSTPARPTGSAAPGGPTTDR